MTYIGNGPDLDAEFKKIIEDLVSKTHMCNPHSAKAVEVYEGNEGQDQLLQQEHLLR